MYFPIGVHCTPIGVQSPIGDLRLCMYMYCSDHFLSFEIMGENLLPAYLQRLKLLPVLCCKIIKLLFSVGVAWFQIYDATF